MLRSGTKIIKKSINICCSKTTQNTENVSVIFILGWERREEFLNTLYIYVKHRTVKHLIVYIQQRV